VRLEQGDGPGPGPGDLAADRRGARRHAGGVEPARGRRLLLHPPAPECGLKGNVMPVLVVIDDEPSILHAFARAFRAPGFTLPPAGSAAEGVELVGRVRPDVVVLDVHLPDATGLATFARLREIDARIPVVLVTGHGTTDLAIEAM